MLLWRHQQLSLLHNIKVSKFWVSAQIRFRTLTKAEYSALCLKPTVYNQINRHLQSYMKLFNKKVHDLHSIVNMYSGYLVYS
jgi:hypothetical protein